jgi:hypothetical protein
MLSPADPQYNYVLNVARENINQARLLTPALAPGNTTPPANTNSCDNDIQCIT